MMFYNMHVIRNLNKKRLNQKQISYLTTFTINTLTLCIWRYDNA